VYIPLPSGPGRRQLFALNMRGVALSDDVDLDALAAASDGYSGADVACVCRDASMMAMRRLMDGARIRARQAKAAATAEGSGVSGGTMLAMRGELLSNKAALENAAVAQADFFAALGKVLRVQRASKG
jgi:SpoVK/Ycf46/Vps4 family AAA+-type ATPase